MTNMKEIKKRREEKKKDEMFRCLQHSSGTGQYT